MKIYCMTATQGLPIDFTINSSFPFEKATDSMNRFEADVPEGAIQYLHPIPKNIVAKNVTIKSESDYHFVVAIFNKSDWIKGGVPVFLFSHLELR